MIFEWLPINLSCPHLSAKFRAFLSLGTIGAKSGRQPLDYVVKAPIHETFAINSDHYFVVCFQIK